MGIPEAPSWIRLTYGSVLVCVGIHVPVEVEQVVDGECPCMRGHTSGAYSVIDTDRGVSLYAWAYTLRNAGIPAFLKNHKPENIQFSRTCQP